MKINHPKGIFNKLLHWVTTHNSCISNDQSASKTRYHQKRFLYCKRRKSCFEYLECENRKIFSFFMKVVHSLDCLNALCQSAYFLKEDLIWWNVKFQIFRDTCRKEVIMLQFISRNLIYLFFFDRDLWDSLVMQYLRNFYRIHYVPESQSWLLFVFRITFKEYCYDDMEGAQKI